MDDLVSEFLSEASEGIQNVSNELIELERNPDKSSLIDDIFRVVHSIKGTCSFFGLTKLAAIAHSSEDIISKIRNKQLKIDQNIISLILESIDTIKEIVVYIGENGEEPKSDYSELIQKIKNVISNDQAAEIKVGENTVENTSKAKNKAEQTIRVNVDTLEKLMQTVSELVLNRNQLVQFDQKSLDKDFSASVYTLNSITSALQEEVMETRLQPISYSWAPLPRMLRDLSQSLHKKITLVMNGESTRLDKQLIEAIKDPIAQLVRNAADHGIEAPAERVAKGKSEEGIITLTACHSNGHVVIEVSDDGMGMDVAKIKAKIQEKNLATAQELAVMSDKQAILYIFNPGFSTSESVTNISGRGVGMGLVKERIERLHGTIDINSAEGKGAVISMTIPLTLAIMPVLLIEVMGQKFAIPQANVVEIIELGDDHKENLEELHGKKLLHLRGELLTSVALVEVLKLSTYIQQRCFVVIYSIVGNHFGLIVDKVYNIEEIVLQPLSKLIELTGMYLGNALLGDDEVVMVLNLNNINKDCEPNITKIAENLKEPQLPKLLIFQIDGLDKAVHLEWVLRLEEIDVSKIELFKQEKIIRYNGLIVPMLVIESKYKIPSKGRQSVIILQVGEQRFFILAEKIIGIVERYTQSNKKSAVIIEDKITEIIDIAAVIRGS